MTTYVHSELTIQSDEATLTNLIFRMGRKDLDAVNHLELDDVIFSLWNIVRPPKLWLGTYYERSSEHAMNWFTWNTQNWGTKWDCGNATIDNQIDNGFITYGFDTVWASPILALNRLAKDYIEAEFINVSNSTKGDSYLSTWKGGRAIGYSDI